MPATDNLRAENILPANLIENIIKHFFKNKNYITFSNYGKTCQNFKTSWKLMKFDLAI